MSIPEFKGALKDKAYTEWFKKSSKSIFIQTSESLRDTEQTRQKTSLLITDNDIKEIGLKLAGRGITNEEFAAIKADLVLATKRRNVIVRKDGTLFYPVINFKDGITNVLAKGFKSLPKVSIIDKTSGVSREARVSDFFQKGHVFSIASNVAEQTRRNLSASNAPESVKNILLPILEEYVTRLKADDLASANVKNSSFDIYAKYSKNPYKYVVEMQATDINQASGVASAPLTNALRRYFDPKRVVEIDKFFRTRATEDSFIQKLIFSKGSPSFIDLAVSKIVNSIKGKSVSVTNFTASTKLDRVVLPIDTKQLRSNIKGKLQEAESAIKKIKQISVAIKKINTTKIVSASSNLTSLQTLINSQLQDVISANMGDGDAKNVLNYRTGRFAASAAVERMSQSRAGMITAFYTYMKNPYQTFEPGFRQGSPKTRDPKLLISGSIRQIAANKVGSRLRAVSI